MTLALTEDRVMPPMLVPGYSRFGVGIAARTMAGNTTSSAAWPTANRAILIPFFLPVPYLVKRVFYVNGTTAGDGARTVDLGVYRGTSGTSLKRLFSTGPTVISATASALIYIDVTDIVLGRGWYYWAHCCNSITTTVMQIAPTLAAAKEIGLGQMATAMPLPDPLTLAAVTATIRLPVSGMTCRATP